MMMAGCFSPPGGGGGGSGDPWGQEFDDERFYRMSARKFNKHMAEKRRRCRINTALERLKYIILHVMRRNPEHFDKMEKADILDLTVKFLKAVQKHQSLSAATSRPSSSSHSTHRGSTSSSTTSIQPRQSRPINIYTDPEVPTPSSSITSDSFHHQGGRERSGMGLKCRSGNIPSAVVRAVPTTSSSPSPRSRPDFGNKGLDYRKRPAESISSPIKSTSYDINANPIKKARISSTVSSAAGRAEPSPKDDDVTAPAFSHPLEYRLHSAFHLHPRDAHWPPTLFCPVPKRPQVSSSSSASSSSSTSFPHASAFMRSHDRPRSPDLDPEPRKPTLVRAPHLDLESRSAVNVSKTQELKIEIPTSQDEAVPPLQPAAARGQDSPHYALPVPGLLTSQVWRPW